MGKKVDLHSVVVVARLLDEAENGFFISKDLTDRALQYSLTFVKKPYVKNEKYIKQDMMLLSDTKLEKLCTFIQTCNESKSEEPNVIECDCFSEVLVYKYFAGEDVIDLAYYDNYFLKTWGNRKYVNSIFVKRDKALEFTNTVLNVIKSDRSKVEDDKH